MSTEADIAEKREQTRILLGKPIMPEFDDTTRKMRTHLLVGSVVAIAATQFGAHINPESTVFGFQFKGVTEGKFLLGLLLINFYLFAHFVWSSHDYFVQWRLRLSGTASASMSSFYAGDDGGEEVQQSTLYSYWMQRNRELKNTEMELKELRLKFDSYSLDGGNDTQSDSLQKFGSLQAMTTALNGLQNSISMGNQIVIDPQVLERLERFDSWFKYFRMSQSVRWCLLELCFPLMLALGSLYGLVVAWLNVSAITAADVLCLFSH